MPFKELNKRKQYCRDYNARSRAIAKERKRMTISFDKALKQVLLSVDTGYRAHGIDNVLDTPPEDHSSNANSKSMIIRRR